WRSPDLRQVVRAARSGDRLSLLPDENAATEQMVDLVKRHRPACARLIEFSALTVKPILQALHQYGASIHLLVRDPYGRSITTPSQKDRVLASLHDLLDVV